MLGRKNYRQEELHQCKEAIQKQLEAYKTLVKAAGTTDKKLGSALGAFEPLFVNSLTLVLDRYFVHRLRMVTGKDGNPLNEVESLLTP